jgi:D-alanine-D-alanine ligase
MYQLLDMRGYGKIDVRMTPDGRVVFLEGNPNPDLSPSGFGRIAGWGGVGYTDLIRRIVRLAMTRRTGRESERGGA